MKTCWKLCWKTFCWKKQLPLKEVVVPMYLYFPPLNSLKFTTEAFNRVKTQGARDKQQQQLHDLDIHLRKSTFKYLDENSLTYWSIEIRYDYTCILQITIHKEYTSNDVNTIDHYEKMTQEFTSYLSLLQTWDPETALTLGTDWNLFAVSAAPSIGLALDDLSHLALRASAFADPEGIQMRDVTNITTRAEVTR